MNLKFKKANFASIQLIATPATSFSFLLALILFTKPLKNQILLFKYPT